MGIPASLSEVPNVNPYIQYVAANGQTQYPYPFPITQDSDLVVVINGTTLPTDGGYTTQGAGNDTGGTITLNIGSTVGDIVTLYRDIPIQRLTQITQNSGFSSAAFNAEFNNLYLIAQQIEAGLALALQIPFTNNPAPITTLTPANYANKYLAFDAFGNPTPAVLTSSGAITTSLLAPFLNLQRSAGEIAAGITPTNLGYTPGNVLRYNADPSGASASDVAVSAALASSSVVYFPSGTYLVQVNHPVTKTTRVYGDGFSSIIHVQSTSGVPSCYGFSPQSMDITFSDLQFQIDVNGKSSCAAISFDTTASKNVAFRRCKFLGLTTKTNNWGLFVNGANLTQLSVHQCWFELLDLGVFKSNSDTSTTKGTVVSDSYFYNCTDGLEINQIVGPWTDVTVSACTFDSNSQFPIGIAGIQRMTVQGCHFTNSQLESVHIEAESNGIKIIGCDFQKSNLTNGVVGAVSIISGSYDVVVQGCDFDLTQNGSGTPFGVTAQPATAPLNVTFTTLPSGTGGTLTAPVAFSTYPYTFLLNFSDGEQKQVTVAASTATLTWVGALTGSPTTAATYNLAPYNVSVIGNQFRCKSGTNTAIQYSQTLGGIISGNLFTNPNPASKASYFIDISDSVVQGTNNTFFNPAALVHTDDNTFGTFADSRIDGDLTSFAFQTGNTNGTTGICFDGFSLRRSFTMATSPAAQTMFPAGTCFDMTVGVRFVFNGSTVSWVSTAKLDWTGSALTVGTTKGSAAAGQAFPTSGQWTASGGNITAAATGNSTYVGSVLITAKGPYFP